MEVLSALLPPVVVALAFVAIARAAFRHTDGQEPAEPDDVESDDLSS